MTSYHCLPLAPMSKSSTNMVAGKRLIKTAAYREWSRVVTLWLRSLRQPLLTPPLCLDCVLVVPNNRRRDLDNACSGLLDCGNGVLWRDDSDVHDLRVRKVLDRSVTAPQLWFKVTRMVDHAVYV